MADVTPNLAGEFALGVLELDEMSAAGRRMRDDAEFRQAVDGWLRRLMPLADRVPPVPTPPAAWAAIQRRISSVMPRRRAVEPRACGSNSRPGRR